MSTVLGLDIGRHRVRGALIKTTMRRTEVLRYMEEPVEAADDPHGRATNLRDAVQRVVRGAGKPPDRVVTSLDGQEASLRVLEIPAGAAKRIGEILPFELEAVLPFAPEEAVVDHQPIDQHEGQLRILAAAAPSERVATRLAELRDVGIDPKELAVGAAALDGLVPLMEGLQRPGPFLLLDVGNVETDVCILENGRCAFARTLSAGLEDAESGRLSQQLKGTLTSWRAAGAAEPVEAWIMGGAATDENSVPWFMSELGMEARTAPLPFAAGAEQSVAQFGRALALACRTTGRAKRLDMRQGEFAPKRAMGAIRQHARLIAIGAGVVFLSFAFATWARWSLLEDENAALQAQLATVTEDAFDEETTSPTRARELLERGPQSQDPLPRFDAYDVLDALSALIPAEITHDTRRLHVELEEGGHTGRFELQGTVASVAQRDEIAAAVEGHECFHELEKGRTTPGPGNEGLNYQIEAQIRCPGAPEPAQEGRRRRSGT